MSMEMLLSPFLEILTDPTDRQTNDKSYTSNKELNLRVNFTLKKYTLLNPQVILFFDSPCIVISFHLTVFF